MTKADQLFERGAAFLEELSHRVATDGGFAARFAEPLAEDAVFLRKMKPTLVMARLRGEQPSENGGPGDAAPPPPPEPAPAPKPKPKAKKKSGGPHPIAVAAAAFAVGVVLAKWIDWRGHAHPRF